MAIDVVVIGGISSDYTILGDDLPAAGEQRRGKTFHEGNGGKGANQAVAAAQLGARVAMIGCVGDDLRGGAQIENLRALGIDVEHVVHVEEPTGASVVLIDGDGNTAGMAAPGANLLLTPERVRRAADLIGTARVLLAQLGVPIEAAVTGMRIARERGLTVMLDPAPAAPLPDEVLSLVDVLKPNADEARALTRTEVRDRDSARDAARRLLDRGVRRAVALQAGKEGNLILTAEGDEHWLPRIPVATVDPTGSGDAFTGALAAELARGQALDRAGAFAHAAAALVSTYIGAQTECLDRKRVEQILRGDVRRGDV